MTVRVAVNGFGRMGRAAVRLAAQDTFDLEIVAINDLGSLGTMAELLRRDSVYGRFDRPVAVAEGAIVVDGAPIPYFSERDPASLPWGRLAVDVVVEATGRFRTRADAAAHLEAGATRVVVSAPCKQADITVVRGVNDHLLDAGHQVISNASCTTNCLAPMVKVLDESFGIVNGLITTVHAYTGDQNLVDGPHKDSRRARAAAVNIVPTTTGAARATGLVLPSLDGLLDGAALRVPVPTGSITDVVALVRTPAPTEAVNDAFRSAATGALNGILDYSEDPLVSSDIIGTAASCTFDSGLTMVGGPLVKVYGWYDNEWGYANRLVELAERAGHLD